MVLTKERLIGLALSRGFALSVDGGGDDFDLELSTDKAAVLDAIGAVDEALVYFYLLGSFKGVVTIVLGLAPDEEIADCCTALYHHIPELEA